jgi:hypothetical protein
MHIVNGHMAENIYEQGMVMPPNAFGYIHLAAEVEKPFPLKPDSRRKKKLIALLHPLAEQLRNLDNVNRVDIFTGLIIPPGSGEGQRFIAKEQLSVFIAQFDLVVLIECQTVDAIKTIAIHPVFQDLENKMTTASKAYLRTEAKNPHRIDEVNKNRQGIFLFNYFMQKILRSCSTFGNTPPAGGPLTPTLPIAPLFSP